jgi:hypothetical protein
MNLPPKLVTLLDNLNRSLPYAGKQIPLGWLTKEDELKDYVFEETLQPKIPFGTYNY